MSQSNKKMSIDDMLLFEKQKNTDKLLVNLLLLVLGLLPLIIRTGLVTFASPVITSTSLDTGIKGDVFTYYKFVWLLIFSGGLLLLFLYKMMGNGYYIKSSYINIPLLIMFVFILLSGVFSEYKTLGIVGQYNRHDGMLTYLCYLLLFFIAANIAYTENKTRWLLYIMYPVITINTGLALLYFYGVDVMKLSFVVSLILPSSIPKESINAGAHFISTLNNPNYTSGIAGVFTPLFLVGAALSKNVSSQINYVVMAVLSFALLLTSLSTSGFVTFIFALPFVLFFIIRSAVVKKGLLTAGTALILFVGVFLTLNSHNPQVWDESVGFFLGSSKGGMEHAQPDSKAWREFAERHSPLHVNVAEAAEQSASQTQQDEFQLPPSAWGPGTGRLYIWSKTLDLIKERPLLGYGLDTLAYYFPQDDPQKNAQLSSANMLVDKPHNMYLGIGYGSGVIALLAFSILILRHFWSHLFLFKQRVATERQKMIAVLFVGWLAYLIQALFNDSIIGTAPIFWILFGAAVSLLRQEREETE
ncbi:O-antigen ligase family protein [Aneurinibacillus tyrosinisolvens]|uniref:O-antigen ligase family protein n=1 Tax=Aneurinibacillus tyrosinisolvens TaxID=1443435 RepID=UPI00069B287C|nr:O-antigen ligase family protein [Aneurinibacillus tyrosinisolvens]